MLTLTKKQEKELRKHLLDLIERRKNLMAISVVQIYYDYKIVSEGASGERIYFKRRNPFTGQYYWEANITTTQAKEYFNI